jgi:hypothetical protein
MRVAKRDADEFIEFLPLMGAIFCALSNAWGVVHPPTGRAVNANAPYGNAKNYAKLCQNCMVL